MPLEVGGLHEGIELRLIQGGCRLLLERAAAVTPLHILHHLANAAIVPAVAVGARKGLVPHWAPIAFGGTLLEIPPEAAARMILKPAGEVRGGLLTEAEALELVARGGRREEEAVICRG